MILEVSRITEAMGKQAPWTGNWTICVCYPAKWARKSAWGSNENSLASRCTGPAGAAGLAGGGIFSQLFWEIIPGAKRKLNLK